jgi:hypothetical protein
MLPSSHADCIFSATADLAEKRTATVGKHAKGAAENVEKLSLRRPGGHPYPSAKANFDSRFKGFSNQDRSGFAFLLARQ